MPEPKTNHMTDGALCDYLKDIEHEYGVRVRVSLVPLSRPSGKSSHAVIARGYYPTGKPIHDLDTEQVLFPGGTSKTFAGAAFYVATQLANVIDEWSVRRRREEEAQAPMDLTPLEQYIAGSF